MSRRLMNNSIPVYLSINLINGQYYREEGIKYIILFYLYL